jgi:hypothetical protein
LNSASFGGGLFCYGNCDVQTTTFSDNKTNCLDGFTLTNKGAGGAIEAWGALTVKRSAFLRNRAGSVGGGAIAYLGSQPGSLHVENSLFARNVATNTVFSAHGAAIVISQTNNTVQLFYNTITDQPRNNVSAIAVFSGTVSAVDNVISGHATGIERFGGTAFENFNLYFDNGSDTSGGVTSGGSSPTGDPLFISAVGDNYHLQFGSPAIDQGSDIAITEDFDVDLRPIGPQVDIGFDERTLLDKYLYLPVIVR